MLLYVSVQWNICFS